MFRPIGSIVQKYTSKGLSRSLVAARLLVTINEYSAGKFEAVRFRAGRLKLIAPTPIDAQELVLEREQIIIKLNQLIGQDIIKTIHIVSR